MKLDSKTVVGCVVTLVMAAVAYFYGPDMVKMVKDRVGSQEVVPVVPESQPAGE